MQTLNDKNKTLLIVFALAMVTFSIYWQTHSFEFVNYDDDRYVSENNHISTGLKWDNVVWVFTNEHVCNWHPVTGLSHILDCELFGLDSGRHHLVNLLLHIANTLLLFTILKRMTGGLWQSAFVASLFAIHPLHVESVVWISERKDVLSTLFWLITMAAYLRYVQKPKISRYLLTFLLFVSGLMAKPMLVTLPFVLLLLDYWPLNRIKNKTQFNNSVREKIPFFIISAIFCAITVLVQSKSGALLSVRQFPLSIRVSNAAVSYIAYITKMFWPTDLAVFYPHPASVHAFWQTAGAFLLLIAFTILAVRISGRCKYLFTGWFWFLGTLVPVIGLVQVGSQSMADRYTYIPYTGLFIALAWGVNELLAKWKYKTIVLWPLSFAIIIIFSVLTYIQAGYWRDSISLFDHAIKVTSKNDTAYYNRAEAHNRKKEYALAISDYTKAIEISPAFTKAYVNRGNAYKNKGNFDFAITDYNKAISLNPQLVEAWNNRGTAYFETGRYEQAISDYNKAIELNPDFAWAYFNKANACESIGRKTEAIAAYKAFLQYCPAEHTSYIEQAKQKINQLEK